MDKINVIHGKVLEASAIVQELSNVLHEREWEANTNHIPMLATAAASILNNVDAMLEEVETN